MNRHKGNNKRAWDIAIGILLVVYIALTTAIFIVHKKIEVLKLVQGEERTLSENHGNRQEKRVKSDDLRSVYQEKEQRLAEVAQQSVKTEKRKELGDFYHHQGKLPQAIIEYQKVLEKKPHNTEIHLKLGMFYMAEKKHHPQALHHFTRILELEPDHPKNKMIQMWIKKLKK